MADEPILIEQRKHVAIVTLNRPRQRNALSSEMLKGVVEALDWAEGESSVRAVVLTGGTKLFASGADLRELRDTTPADYLRAERQKAWPRIAAFKKPLVAAVAGYVLGGGCEVALSCDFVVAADSAVFGQPEIRLGLIPGAGGTQRWARVAGRFEAAELVLLGKTVDAWTAKRMGLVNRVVPAECVVEAGVAMAEEAARHSPVAGLLAKSALRASEEIGVSAGLDLERSQLMVALSSADRTEGIDAFLEKRPPQFQGR
ncbi:enoyl-CoA hydratase-related protein [Nonomuraea sp. NPDC049486]|uniref:enoyl-CoA hydratase-related protein n=1 Tax=Nonomuraea sp. NPDC049486 TaxID=3155773 RepID=UPI003440A5DE